MDLFNIKAIEEASIEINITLKLFSSSSKIKYENNIENRVEKNNRKKNDINVIIY